MKKVIIAAILLTSCNDVFDTHPYDIHFDGETGINAKQIAKIESQFAEKDTLRVAFISDTHGWYSDTKDEVADLNQRMDISIQHYRKYWDSLIPTQFIVQNAGNMGVVSAGIGWNYGKHCQ